MLQKLTIFYLYVFLTHFAGVKAKVF